MSYWRDVRDAPGLGGKFRAALGLSFTQSSSTASTSGAGSLFTTPPERNSIVIACIRWVQRTISEAPAILQRWNADAEEWEEVVFPDPAEPGTRILDLLQQPNDCYPSTSLWKATIEDLILRGNAYWVLQRNGVGAPESIWWVPATRIAPRANESSPLGAIDYYEMAYASGTRRYPVDDIVHFRDGLDPNNPCLGKSGITTLLQEILLDEKASSMATTLMTNSGHAGVILGPEAGTIPPEIARSIEDTYRQKFSGTGAGGVMVTSGQLVPHSIAFTPQQLQMREQRTVPEERVAAIIGTNPAVIGLGSGLASTKVGAPQPLSALLWSPTGALEMGEVEVGQVIAIPGGWAPVLAVYPQGERDIYRVTFQDGSTAESTYDHLWEIDVPSNGGRPAHRETRTLEEIAGFGWDRLKRTSVPLQGVVEFAEQPTMIPPYFLGLLLGDGTFRHQLCLSNTSSEIIQSARAELPASYALVHHDKGDYRVSYATPNEGRGRGGGSGGVSPYKDELRRLGLWMKYSHEKFVPDLYKYNTSAVRREVLRGILDTDGFVNQHGQPAIEQTSPQLAKDITWLVQSLGGYTLNTRKRANRNLRFIAGRPMRSKHDRIHQSIVIDDAPSLFRYSAKRDKCRARTKPPTRKFRAIEFVRREQAQCISLPGSLYLTDSFIVTHNTLREYREEAFESTIIPWYRDLQAHISQQLLPQFGLGPDWKLIFNLREVRVLQEDELAKTERIAGLVAGGILTVAEGRRFLGYPIAEDGSQDIYLRPVNLDQIPADRRLDVQDNPLPPLAERMTNGAAADEDLMGATMERLTR